MSSLDSSASFYSMAHIPCTNAPQEQAVGKCVTNVDGQCLSGGTLQGGASGYSLVALGGAPTSCASARIFAAQNGRYTANTAGWVTSTNANVLRLLRPL